MLLTNLDIHLSSVRLPPSPAVFAPAATVVPRRPPSSDLQERGWNVLAESGRRVKTNCGEASRGRDGTSQHERQTYDHDSCGCSGSAVIDRVHPPRRAGRHDCHLASSSPPLAIRAFLPVRCRGTMQRRRTNRSSKTNQPSEKPASTHNQLSSVAH